MNIKIAYQRTSNRTLKSRVKRISIHSVRHSDIKEKKRGEVLMVWPLCLNGWSKNLQILDFNRYLDVCWQFIFKYSTKEEQNMFLVFLCVKYALFLKGWMRSQLDWSLCFTEWIKIRQTLNFIGHLDALWWNISKFTQE